MRIHYCLRMVENFKRKMMEHLLESKDTALLVHIEHEKPIEISDFVAMLNSVGGLYTNFVKTTIYEKDVSPKLYVEKIERGCIDVYLCELFTTSLIPFVENTNTILAFAKYLKEAVEHYTVGKGEKKCTPAESKKLHDLFTVTANDPKSAASISAIERNNSSIHFHNCTFNYCSSCGAQKQLEEELSNAQTEAYQETVLQNKLLTIHQMVGDVTVSRGNKAVIESVSNKAIGLLFENDDIKTEMLHMDSNPVKKAFYVDVALMHANGKLAAYKVLKLHDIVDLQE